MHEFPASSFYGFYSVFYNFHSAFLPNAPYSGLILPNNRQIYICCAIKKNLNRHIKLFFCYMPRT